LEPGPPPRGGLHLWLTLPSQVDDVELSDQARAQDLVVGAGRAYFVTEPPGPRLRLSYAGADEAQLSAGVQVLAAVLGRA
jgi:DNA-binding transcriptional MocR family regulator